MIKEDWNKEGGRRRGRRREVGRRGRMTGRYGNFETERLVL
jgi:hypothetical protein